MPLLLLIDRKTTACMYVLLFLSVRLIITSGAASRAHMVKVLHCTSCTRLERCSPSPYTKTDAKVVDICRN